jgi:hypothetical protein
MLKGRSGTDGSELVSSGARKRARVAVRARPYRLPRVARSLYSLGSGLLGLPGTLCWRAHSLAALPVVVVWFGFDWANAKLVPSTVMIAAMLAIFFIFLPLGVVLPLPHQHHLKSFVHAVCSAHLCAVHLAHILLTPTFHIRAPLNASAVEGSIRR